MNVEDALRALLALLQGAGRAAETAALVAKHSLFGRLARTGGGADGIGYFVAQPDAVAAATAEVADQPRHILSVIQRYDAALLSLLPPGAAAAGAGLRMIAYLPPAGKVLPHRAGPGGVNPLAHGLGGRLQRRAARLRRQPVRVCIIVADRSDRAVVMRTSTWTPARGGQVTMELRSSLAVHATGLTGSGRVRASAADGFVLHGQWVPGMPEPGPSLTFVRELVIDAASETDATGVVQAATHAAGHRVCDENERMGL